jgi:hypothetical protein
VGREKEEKEKKKKKEKERKKKEKRRFVGGATERGRANGGERVQRMILCTVKY